MWTSFDRTKQVPFAIFGCALALLAPQMLRGFLGHDPTADAFLKAHGIESSGGGAAATTTASGTSE